MNTKKRGIMISEKILENEIGYYCGIETVMKDLQVSKSRAYVIIAEMNQLLLQQTGKESGVGSNKILIRKGKIPRKFYNKLLEEFGNV